MTNRIEIPQPPRRFWLVTHDANGVVRASTDRDIRDAGYVPKIDEETEHARWQQRIEEVIRSHDIEPIDPSGNESGDPLDWSADQIGAALAQFAEGDAEYRAQAREAERRLEELTKKWTAQSEDLVKARRELVSLRKLEQAARDVLRAHDVMYGHDRALEALRAECLRTALLPQPDRCLSPQSEQTKEHGTER